MNQSNKPSDILPGISHVFNLEGFIQTLTEAPSVAPRKFSEQIVLVRAGGSTAAYFYDTKNTTWKYVTLT